MKITITPNPNHGTLPASDKLGFGTVFTDHMFLMDYTDRDGWHNARIVPFGPDLRRRPAASVLHYGTEVFEGLKAYRRPDGEVQLFRPWENVARLNRSCDRLGLPRIDEEDGSGGHQGACEDGRQLGSVRPRHIPLHPPVPVFAPTRRWRCTACMRQRLPSSSPRPAATSQTASSPFPSWSRPRTCARCAAARARQSAAATTRQPTAPATRPSKRAIRRCCGSTAWSASTSKRAAA